MNKKCDRTEINKKKREESGFERNPPRCQNCIFFIKKIKASTNIKFKPAKCKLNNFSIEEYSICNNWKDRGGNSLEL